jgi:hypothetical protein
MRHDPAYLNTPAFTSGEDGRLFVLTVDRVCPQAWLGLRGMFRSSQLCQQLCQPHRSRSSCDDLRRGEPALSLVEGDLLFSLRKDASRSSQNGRHENVHERREDFVQ